VSHLLYADDCILFCKANPEEGKAIKTILDQYQEASGQRVNLDKSDMFFSPNISLEAKKLFQDQLPVNISDCINKYLGMPTHFGRSKEQDFSFLMEKIWSKLKGWKEKRLSFEGRSVLIKVVAQAIPTYIMSCFLIPNGVCEKIESAICNFWWGNSSNSRKIHWIKKDRLFKPKYEGGQGFKTLRDFNLAMLAKQVWRMQTNPDSLLARCFKAKYFPNSSILKASIGCNPSFAWRSIHTSIMVITKGSCWRIGNGKSINIWNDNWLPFQSNFKPYTKAPAQTTLSHVNDLIDSNTNDWNQAIIESTFYPIDQIHIPQLPIINSFEEDEIMWMHEHSWQYSVKSGYKALQIWKQESIDQPSTSNEENPLWDTI
jgi:hypothetical protein